MINLIIKKRLINRKVKKEHLLLNDALIETVNLNNCKKLKLLQLKIKIFKINLFYQIKKTKL